MNTKLVCLIITLALVLGLMPAAMGEDTLDYGKPEYWAFAEVDRTDTDADVFFVTPTTYTGALTHMPVDDEAARTGFVYAINMEKGIYDDNARFFAPYYRLISLGVYERPEAEWEPYLCLAYSDVKAAFEYYLEHWNNGRPIVLAGFSQGADHCIRLMKDCFEACSDRIVACYAIGWRFTEADQREAPYLKFASGETDTGVIIAYNTEAEQVTGSLMVPSDVKTMCINPLNWKADGTPADRSLNLGACFPNVAGAIDTEIPQMTGAYIDPVRGTLKAPDIDPAVYPSGLTLFPEGVYHLYDYMFFYRNLEKNVQDRIASFIAQK